MLLRSKLTKMFVIGAVFGISAVMPTAPAIAGPNCAVQAYLFCKDGQWAAHGYASEAECRYWEEQLCGGSSFRATGWQLTDYKE